MRGWAPCPWKANFPLFLPLEKETACDDIFPFPVEDLSLPLTKGLDALEVESTEFIEGTIAFARGFEVEDVFFFPLTGPSVICTVKKKLTTVHIV